MLFNMQISEVSKKTDMILTEKEQYLQTRKHLVEDELHLFITRLSLSQ